MLLIRKLIWPILTATEAQLVLLMKKEKASVSCWLGASLIPSVICMVI